MRAEFARARAKGPAPLRGPDPTGAGPARRREKGVPELSKSAIPEALVCQSCGGRLEAAAKVYFDLTTAERRADGELVVTGIEIAELNDSFDGHPAALESELVVSCKECGEAAEFRLAGAALARTQFYRALLAA